MTFAEAAGLAKEGGNVDELLITHFSPSRGSSRNIYKKTPQIYFLTLF